jgi:uncharacterized protein YndB with AHSA1/START domain
MTAASDVDDRTLVLTRVFDAPRALVFQAWTDAERVAQWWGPQGFITQYCQMDIRPGGSFRLCMRSPAGTDHWKRGVYQEIVAPERIVFTFAWENADGQAGHETVVTVLFDALGNKTRLTLRQAVFESVSQCDSHRGGWTSCLERFAAWLANG